MEIKFEITKGRFYFLVLVGVFVLSGFFVYAYNSGTSPAVMGHSGEEIHVSVDGETKLLNDAFDDLAFSCPSGFTLVESQGYVLGCIQNDEEGSANFDDASNNCFTNYGGRLPLMNEWFVATDNYELTNENDDRELVGYFYLCYGLYNTDACAGGSYMGVYPYRCFIPAH